LLPARHFEQDDARETASPVGHFIKDDEQTGISRHATLAIDTRDCIGCEVCVARCDKGVLRMIDGKALIPAVTRALCDPYPARRANVTASVIRHSDRHRAGRLAVT
jgi:NAD-dependent dihydropyrimidine dehydrogenase PreA subunit